MHNYDFLAVQSEGDYNLTIKALYEEMRLLMPIVIEGINLVEAMKNEPEEDVNLLSIINDLNRQLLLNMLATLISCYKTVLTLHT